MPFCVQCGSQVGDNDAFCTSCGAPQEKGRRAQSRRKQASADASDFLAAMNSRTAATLCYIPLVGWVGSIIVLAAERFRADQTVRFHAFQGLYLFVAYLFVDWVFGPIMGSIEATRVIGKLLKVMVFGVWVYMLVTVRQGQDIRLPLLGELADRSVSEQK